MQKVESKITDVTVFMDRALITRKATISFPKGEQVAVFTHLSASLDENSIQVSGEGNATIAYVKLKKNFLEQVSDQNKRQLLEQKESLEAQAKEGKDKVEQYQKQMALVDNIAEKITHKTEKTDQGELDASKWERIMAFYETQTVKNQALMRQAEKELKNLQAQIEKVRQELNEMNQSKAKMEYEVHVGVEMEEDAELVLALSYLVPDVRWYPLYDMRVDSEAKKVAIHYQAMIQQKTTEKWEQVQVKLSTAKPNISRESPKLSPWHIHLASPTRGMSFASKSMESANYEAIRMQKALLEESREDADESIDKKKKSVSSKSAQTDTQATAVLFLIQGKYDIPHDNSPHQVSILLQEFSAQFRYSTVPKLSPFAYLKAKISNESEFPFLAGDTNIFLDNHFVAKGLIQNVAPTENFWISLGIDEGMKIQYRFLKKYEKTEGGVISKKHKVLIYEYQIQIRNYKKNTEEIVIWDQLPISDNQKIKVTLLEPPYKQDTENLMKNEWEGLKWFHQIKPQEEKTILFKYSVEFPADLQVIGLE